MYVHKGYMQSVTNVFRVHDCFCVLVYYVLCGLSLQCTKVNYWDVVKCNVCTLHICICFIRYCSSTPYMYCPYLPHLPSMLAWCNGELYSIAPHQQPDHRVDISCVYCSCLSCPLQYIHPSDSHKLDQAELVVVDEAAAIPLPLVRQLMGPYLVFMASTVNGYVSCLCLFA